jgi:hypothetical protein
MIALIAAIAASVTGTTASVPSAGCAVSTIAYIARLAACIATFSASVEAKARLAATMFPAEAAYRAKGTRGVRASPLT